MMSDQQAYLDFAFHANAEVAEIAKHIIFRYRGAPEKRRIKDPYYTTARGLSVPRSNPPWRNQ